MKLMNYIHDGKMNLLLNKTIFFWFKSFRFFRCDCGNSRLSHQPCKLYSVGTFVENKFVGQ